MVNYIGADSYALDLQRHGTFASDTGAIYGGLGATDFPGRIVRDVRDEIFLLDANNAALTTLIRNMKKQKAHTPKVEWFEDQFNEQNSATVAAGSTTTDTSMLVTNGDGKLFRKGDLWLIATTGEIVYVVDVPAESTTGSDEVTVIRGIGGTTAAAAYDTTDTLYYIGNAQSTGDIARPMLTTQTVPKYNYLQIFKEATEVTRTAQQTMTYGGPERKRLRYKHGKIHMRDIERGMWFGNKDVKYASDNANIRHAAYITGGVLEFIASGNEISNSGSFSYLDFSTHMEDAFRYGNKTKTMFCSPRANTVIDYWCESKLQTVPSTSTYGVNVKRLQTSHGNLNIIRNDVFYDFSSTNLADAYNECAVILQLEDLTYRYMHETILELGIQENDRHTYEDQFTTHCGLEMHFPDHHTEIYGWNA
jgi:hypothetical protein